MARPDDARAALRVLNQHAKMVIDACLEDGGRIAESDDNEKALGALRQHRLVFELDEERQQAQVSRVVSELMHHITQSYRRQLSCSAAAGMMEELESVIEAYHLARASGSRDLAMREAEAQEIVAALIDTLRQITQRFTSYIHSEFSYVVDLDQRIHENRRALREAKDLNRLFDTLTPGYLLDKSGASSALQYLLTKILRRNLERLRKDLVDANHGLRENLARLEKDQQARRRSNMVEGFLRHYEQNPGYSPDPGLLEVSRHVPEVFCGVAPVSMRAQPNLDDASQHDDLRLLLAGALNRESARDREKGKAEDAEPVSVRDSRESQVEVAPEPFDQALDYFFDALPRLAMVTPQVSSMAAYELLEVAEPADVWLLGVYGRYQALLGGAAPPYVANLVEAVVPRYSGNRLVSDIVFELKEAA